MLHQNLTSFEAARFPAKPHQECETPKINTGRIPSPQALPAPRGDALQLINKMKKEIAYQGSGCEGDG